MDLLNILGNIGFDWKLALANLANFLIIYYLLKRYAFKPVGKIIDERRQKVEKGLSDAVKAEAELLNSKKEGEQIIRNAKHESNEIIAKAHDQAKELIEFANIQAVKEKADILAKAKTKIKNEQREMEVSMRSQISELVIACTEKVIGETLTGDLHNKVIDRMVNTK